MKKYCCGSECRRTIIDGESDEESAGGDTIAKLLRQAYNQKVKAVVLALILRAVALLHQKLFVRKLKILKKQVSLLWYLWAVWLHLVGY